MLGFATVAQGDIALTPLGETFAEASILARKEMFAARLRRVPLFKWLLGMLKAAHQRQLEREVIQTALELEFPSAEADRQLDTIIDWGRYAEMVVYDDADQLFFLDPVAQAVR